MECPNCGSSNCVARDGLQGICVDCDTVWDVDEQNSTSYPADELAFATDTLIGEIEAIEEACPDCGAGCLWKRKIRRDGKVISEVLCEKCEYYRVDSNEDVTFWGTPPEDDETILVCPKCGDEINSEDYCDSCGWYEDEDYDPYSYIGWDGHEH